jgi:hypothetical protein
MPYNPKQTVHDMKYISNSMELNSTLEVTRCAATQELRNNLWNPKFHYRVQRAFNGPYPEPGHSSSYHSIPSLQIRY